MQYQTILMLLLLTLSCKSQEFSAGGNIKKKNTIEENTTIQEIPGNCSTQNILKARLLSDGLSRRPVNNSIRFELELISCQQGTPISLQNEVISFDIDATGLYLLDLSFRLIDPATSQSIYDGTLKSIQGEDLFGKTGKFSHNKSSPLSLNLKTNKVVIEIFLQEKPIDSLDGSDSIDSYFRIGSSNAVVQIIPLKV